MSDYRKTNLNRQTRRFPVPEATNLEEAGEEVLNFTVLRKSRIENKRIVCRLRPVVAGSARDCDVVLDGLQIDRHQLSIAVLGDELLFVDRGREKVSFLNGRFGLQDLISINDCMVVQFKDEVIIYHGLRHKATQEPDSGCFLCLQGNDGRRYYSEGRPLLIGSNSNCGVTLTGEDVPEYCVAVFWTEYGIVVSPLINKSSVLKVNGYDIEETVLVDVGDRLEFGKRTFAIGFYGDVNSMSREFFPPLLQEGTLGFSFVGGIAAGRRGILDEGTYTFGNSVADDFQIQDDELSGNSMDVTLRKDCFSFRKNQQSVKLSLNGVECRSGIAHPGDTLALGQNILVIYYR